MCFKQTCVISTAEWYILPLPAAPALTWILWGIVVNTPEGRISRCHFHVWKETSGESPDPILHRRSYLKTAKVRQRENRGWHLCWRWLTMVNGFVYIECFSSLDDHSKLFTVQFYIHPIHTVHLWAALCCSMTITKEWANWPSGLHQG